MLGEKYQQAWEKIKQAKNVLLITHDRPDGDALSSLSIMMEILEQNKIMFTAFCADKPPAPYNYLAHMEKINPDKNNLDFHSFDLIIILDCGAKTRTNLQREIDEKNHKQYIIEFDHHPKVDNYADLEIRLPQATSTAEILYLFIVKNSIEINKNLANAVLTGIMTDTGNLLYDSTSPQAVKIASDMLLHGAQFSSVIQNTSRNKSLDAMKLWGIALSHLEINPKYNFAFSVLTNEQLKSSGATDEELEGIAGFLSSLHGVNGLLFIREENDNLIKGSLRTTKKGVDISRLASVLGGGGHSLASAFKLKGKIIKENNNWKIILI